MDDPVRRSSGSKIKAFVKSLTGASKEDELDESSASSTPGIEAIEPRSEKGLRRVLYTANVGDARAVLWSVTPSEVGLGLIPSRGGKAVRLTYDHKGSDSQEAKRITDAGGFVMNNRVNGELESVSQPPQLIRQASWR